MFKLRISSSTEENHGKHQLIWSGKTTNVYRLHSGSGCRVGDPQRSAGVGVLYHLQIFLETLLVCVCVCVCVCPFIIKGHCK
jgi:hypothetical protein